MAEPATPGMDQLRRSMSEVDKSFGTEAKDRPQPRRSLRAELSERRAQLNNELAHHDTQIEAIRARLEGIEQMRREAEAKLRARRVQADETRRDLTMLQRALDAEPEE